MASLYERNGTFYAHFHCSDCGRKRVSLRTKDKSTARALLTEWERLFRLGEADPWRDNMHEAVRPDRPQKKRLTLAEAFSQFLESKQAEGCRESTLQTYRWTVGRMIREHGAQKLLKELTPRVLRSYVLPKEVAPATRRKRYRQIRAFLNYYSERLEESPLEEVEKPRRDERMPKAVRFEELQAITEAIKARYRELRTVSQIPPGRLIWRVPVFQFLFLTGLRRSEVASLRWRSLDTKDCTITLKGQKNRKEQRLPLPRKAAGLLRRIPQGKGGEYVFADPCESRTERSELTWGQSLSRSFAKYRDLAGVREEVSLHNLRAGFITRLAKSGAPPVAVQKLARHADFKTTLGYLEATGESFRDDLDKAFE
jgi:integrase